MGLIITFPKNNPNSTATPSFSQSSHSSNTKPQSHSRNRRSPSWAAYASNDILFHASSRAADAACRRRTFRRACGECGELAKSAIDIVVIVGSQKGRRAW